MSATTTTSLPSSENILSVQDISSSLQRFGWADYFVFVLMLMVCAGIGVYFGFVEKKKKYEQKNSKENDIEDRRGSEALDYLVGGRKMKVIPVSLSLVASFVSGISLLGTSTEIYVYGTQYAFILITIVIAGFISWYIFLPVFVNLQLTSTYEYFERRFNSSLRFFGSVLFVVGEAVWFPIALYVPALTFNQVTGIGVHVITPIVCGIVTFYTCVGGLKAVVWTDVVQSGLMYGSILLVMIKGTYDLGGLGVVLQRNEDSGRLISAELTWDPTVRMSMLAVLIGGTFLRLQGTSIHQVGVQRFLSLPSCREVKTSLMICSVGLFILLGSCVYTGILAYAFYYDCDPTTTGLAQAKDQIVPVYIMKVLEKYPGLSGVFVSGVFSAALSSLSSSLNSLAAVIHEDFFKKFRKTPLTEKQSAFIMRSTVVIVGILGFSLVFVVEKLGTVMQLSATMQSITQGPLLAIFTIGMCIPWIKAESTITGGVMAFVVMAWICIKAQLAIATGDMVFRPKPISIDGCEYDYGNITIPDAVKYVEDYSEKSIYNISFMWYCPLGFAITLGVAVLTSFVYGWNDTSEVDRSLIAAPVHRFMRPEKYKSVKNFVDNFEKTKL